MHLFAPDGAQPIQRAQSGQMGIFMHALMGHLAFHVRTLIADGGTGKLSPWTFVIAPEGAQSRGGWIGGGGRLLPQNSNTQEVPFFLTKKCNFLK